MKPQCTVTFEEAESVVKEAIKIARKRHIAIAVSVVNYNGPISSETIAGEEDDYKAEDKARVALGLKIPTSALQVRRQTEDKREKIPGGVPFKHPHVNFVMGAVGIDGPDGIEQEIALEAIEKAGFVPKVFHENLEWICSECGRKYGEHEPEVVTWHQGECGVCGKEKSVTRLWNYL